MILNREEIKEITGYILYDLFELGWLTQEAADGAIFKNNIPEKILIEMESAINQVIKDKLEKQ